jgi:hypothetical protein
MQSGTLDVVAKEEGVVNFPIPYALPPNVELSGGFTQKVVLKDITATGFKWKGTDMDHRLTWTARGVKATKLPERDGK